MFLQLNLHSLELPLHTWNVWSQGKDENRFQNQPNKKMQMIPPSKIIAKFDAFSHLYKTGWSKQAAHKKLSFSVAYVEEQETCLANSNNGTFYQPSLPSPKIF